MSAQKTSGILEKNFTAGGAIGLGDIVKFGTDDDTVVVGAAATDALIGVAEHAAALGESVRVQMLGIAKVEAGGTIARGALVTSNGTGKGVAAAATNSVIGRAMQSKVSGDIVHVFLSNGIHT